ncbi:hypothetical protein [Clostridium sp. 'White wine YQ']|uniref:hypothetical protein n=1 Tax=Clostridium sp. 'White wine YQ' TaxID=3027474 RepID=UPI002366A26D|nr:hypothetical protein [Clostridium sp. 'White wine YQ']MDD7796060.1 hypothetical protein [Clostridium sp. 'White wine YQ']
MINTKKVVKVMLGLLLCAFIFGKDNIAQSKAFYMALAPYSSFRAVDADDTRDSKDYLSYSSGYINLATIYDVDSYYVQARAVASPYADLNAASNIYSSTVLAKQGSGNVPIPEGYSGKKMSLGSTYYLALKNINSTTDYRNASGTFGWY